MFYFIFAWLKLVAPYTFIKDYLGNFLSRTFKVGLRIKMQLNFPYISALLQSFLHSLALVSQSLIALYKMPSKISRCHCCIFFLVSFPLLSVPSEDDDGDDDDNTEVGDLAAGTVKSSIKQATKTARRTKARETLFQRIEESRKALEDELGTEKFLKVYRYIQVYLLFFY